MTELDLGLDEETLAKLRDMEKFYELPAKDLLKQFVRDYHVENGNLAVVMYKHMASQAPLILEQIRQNWRHIENGKSVNLYKEMELQQWKSDLALIIANGPSLSDQQLRALSVSDFRARGGKIICVDSALRRVLRAGIIPDIVLLLDRQQCANVFFDDPVVREYDRRLNYFLPIDIHPEVRDMLRGERWWYVAAYLENPTKNLTAYLRGLLPQLPILPPSGNVGVFGLMVAWFLKKRRIGFIGLDLGWPASTEPWETDNFDLEVRDLGGVPVYDDKGVFQKVLWPCESSGCPDARVFKGACRGTGSMDMCQREFDSQYPHVKDHWGNMRLTNKVYDLYRDILQDHVDQATRMDPGTRFINCTGAGLATDDKHIEIMDFDDFLKER